VKATVPRSQDLFMKIYNFKIFFCQSYSTALISFPLKPFTLAGSELRSSSPVADALPLHRATPSTDYYHSQISA
jgi:hypothetical protein